MKRSLTALAMTSAVLLACVPSALFGQAKETFDSAEEAAQAAIAAAGRDDAAALSSIFGPNSRGLLTSGDPKQDQAERTQFAKVAGSKHRLEADPMNPDKTILAIGSQDWPFPIPIVRTGGKWSFDASQGALEMRARRIGANEIDIIETLAGYVAAQQEYAAKVRDEHGLLEYAQRLKGAPGTQESLYAEGGSPLVPNLVPKDFAEAEVAGQRGAAKPYRGYYFRILKMQGPNARGGAHNYVVKGSMIGGFALVAWPAQHGVSGIHTFIVNHDGDIYEKDLGKLAPVTRFDPDKSWTRVD